MAQKISIFSPKRGHNTIKEGLISSNIAGDLSYIIEQYTNKKMEIFSIDYQYRNTICWEYYNFVALATDQYEFLDMFFTYFQLEITEHINKQSYTYFSTRIKKKSNKIFNSSSGRPVLLFSTFFETGYYQSYEMKYYKYFRDGYRRGEDIIQEENNYINNTKIKKFPARWIHFISEDEIISENEEFPCNTSFIRFKSQTKKYLEENNFIVTDESIKEMKKLYYYSIQ